MNEGILRRARTAAIAVATAAAGFLPLVAAAPSAHANASIACDRLAGATRHGTAQAIAEAFGTADSVAIARDDLFPDALAGSYLGVPILLTNSQSLSSEAGQAIQNVKAKNVTILGGVAAVSTNVENQLKGTTSSSASGGNLNVNRLGGADRFDTARLIGTNGGAGNVGQVGGKNTAIVASGRNFPDALTGGPASYASSLPIFLVEQNSVPAATDQGLTSDAVNNIILLGGTVAVSQAVETQLATHGTVTRIGGADRTETATKFADFELANLGFANTHFNLARGNDFADALAGGPHAGAEKAPILLANDPNTLGQFTTTWLQGKAQTLTDCDVFGGTAAISDATETAAEQAAGATGHGGQATLASSSVPQGGSVSGTVQNPSSVQSLSVSGCGFGNQAVAINAQGQFSFNLPAGQATGSCTLTFTIQRTDGTSTTEDEPITVTTTQQANTAAPDLVSATADPVNDVVTYAFDEAPSGAAVAAGNFHVYDNAGNQDPSGGSTGTTVNGNNVVVQFPAGTISGNVLTTATIEPAAVQDAGGLKSPESSVPLNNVTFQAGRTSAPDLISVTNTSLTDAAGNRQADFTFDQAVGPVGSTQGQAVPGAAAFHLFESDNTDNTGVTAVIQSADLTAVLVTFGLGNTIPVSQIVRGAVDTGTVVSRNAAAIPNPLEAVDVQASGITTGPDLVSASVSGTNQVDFVFDQDVAAATLNNAQFKVFSSGAVETAATGVTRSSSDARRVTGTFPAGIVGGAVGANVDDAAAVGTTGGALPNQEDSAALQNVVFQGGRTALPDLVSVTISKDPAGQPVVIFTFDSSLNTVGYAPALNDFHLYDANAAQFLPTGPGFVNPTNPAQVIFNASSGAGQFTTSQATAAIQGGVNNLSGGDTQFPEGDAPTQKSGF